MIMNIFVVGNIHVYILKHINEFYILYVLRLILLVYGTEPCGEIDIADDVIVIEV